MKTLKLSLLFFLLVSPLFAVVQQAGKITFAKGWNPSTIETALEDGESPDMCNCTSDLSGALNKRGGSKKFIDQAYSSNPVTSLYRAYFSTGTGAIKATIATIGNSVVYSTDDTNPQWVTVSSNITPGQHWSFVTMNNLVLMTPDGLYDDIKKFNVQTGSFTNLIQSNVSSTTVSVSSISAVIRAKYSITSKNYYIVGNVAYVSTAGLPGSTTYYPSQINYSILNQTSSMTVVRFIEYRTNDGEDITGLGEMNDRVNIFKPTSIGDLDFTTLNLPSQGGDWVLTQVVKGFGLVAPRSLANTGQFYVMASQDGIRLWDGGARSRLTPSDESRLISDKIQTLIEKLIRAGTYDKIAGKYYPSKEWYVMSYIDPDKFPQNKHNAVVIYDFKTGDWFPFCNWNAESIEVWSNAGDNGELMFGDSNDGYVRIADIKDKIDDSPREIWVDSMDSTFTWTGAADLFLRDPYVVREGTASLKLAITDSVTSSSMTRIAVLNFGEWTDKETVPRSNASIRFKINVSSRIHISSFSVDLRVNDEAGAFDLLYTSYSISSATLVDNQWTEVRIDISSFGSNPAWTDLAEEEVQFADSLTFYGVRFNLWGVDGASVAVDDVRIVENKDEPNNFYRFSKIFDMGNLAQKTFGQIWTTREKDASSNLKVDIYSDFGKKVKTREYKAEIGKEIFVCSYSSAFNITVLSSIDFSVIRSTNFSQPVGDYLNGVADRNHVFVYDRQNNREAKFNRNDLSALVSTYGSLGTGTTNFNLGHQHAANQTSLFVIDIDNNRFKEHLKRDYSFVRQYGTLGNGTTSLHQPTGIAVTDKEDGYVYIADDAQRRILVLSQSTFGVVLAVDLNYNNIGDTSLALTPTSILVAYNKTSEESAEGQDVILEVRDRGDPKRLLSITKIRPRFPSSGNPIYSLDGDIGVLGRYVFISFSDDDNGRYFIQKLLHDGTIVRELETDGVNSTIMADGLSYLPSIKNESADLDVEGKHIQVKFYDEGNDNDVRIPDYSIMLEQEPLIYE